MSLRQAILDAVQIRRTGEGIKTHETLPGLLVFAVVAADLMSTPMYVVGLLARSLGFQQWVYLFLLSILLGLLLPFYWKVMTRYSPEGGGVTSLAEKAFHPIAGQIGAWMMVADYALTVAISSASAVYYLTAYLPIAGGFPKEGVIALTVVLIGFLWWLNILGVKESAGAALKATVSTLLIYVVVVALSMYKVQVWGIKPENEPMRHVQAVFALKEWSFMAVAGFLLIFLRNFASAFLALTGLESGAQIAHHVREPRGRHAGIGLILVWVVFILTPLLGLATSLLMNLNDPSIKTKGDYLLAELAKLVGGTPLLVVFVIGGGLILAFAANTGMIGFNAVLQRMAHLGALPRGILQTGKRGTPVLSVSIVAISSALIVILVHGEMEMLGHLYAFGVVGSVVLTLMSVFRLRMMEENKGRWWINGLLLVSILIMFTIFMFNIRYKPEAAIMGFTVIALGLGLGYSNKRYGKEMEVALKEALAPVASKVVYGHLHEHKLDVIGDAIVVATRGGGTEVVKMAAELAALRGAELYLLYVCESPIEWRPADWTAEDDPRGQRILEEAVAVAEEYGIMPHPVHVVASSAGIAILELIHAVNGKTLVMGIPTRGRLERLVRGDVVKFVESHRPTDLHIMYYSP